MTIRWMLSLGGVLLMVAGCASEPPRSQQQIDSTLRQLDADADYGATERCLSTHEYDTVEVLNEQHLLFRGSPRDEVWLNKLRHRCPGLHDDDTLAFDMHGNRLCSLDTASVVERFLFWRRTGPTCSLGEFQQLTEAQARLVNDAL